MGVNDIANIECLVASMLLFEVVTTFHISNFKFNGHKTRPQVIVDAPPYMVISLQRIVLYYQSSQTKLCPALTHEIKPREELLVYREKYKHWTGPYKLNCEEDKMASITDGKFSQPFSSTQILPYTANKRDL